MVLNEVEKGKMVGRETAEVSGGSERNRCRILAAYRGGICGVTWEAGKKAGSFFRRRDSEKVVKFTLGVQQRGRPGYQGPFSRPSSPLPKEKKAILKPLRPNPAPDHP